MSNHTEKIKLPEVYTLKSNIKVYIDEDFISQVTYLCNEIYDVEWSGVLFYSIENDITSPKDFNVKLQYIYLMNKGTGAYTEYEFNEELVEFRMNNPESLQWKMGHIHSHNNMKSYFSGTDMEELTENSEHHNYYLSIVVNNKLDIVGKVGFRGISSENTIYNCKEKDGKNYKLSTNINKEIQFVYDCEIIRQFEEKVKPGFIERLKTIIKKKTVKDAIDAKAKVEIKPYEKPHFNKQQQLALQAYYNRDWENPEDEIVDEVIIDDEIDGFTSYWILSGTLGSESLSIGDALEQLTAQLKDKEETNKYVTDLISISVDLFIKFYDSEKIDDEFQHIYLNISEYAGVYDVADELSKGLEIFIKHLNKE